MGTFGQVLSNGGVITNWSILPKEVLALHQTPQPWCSTGRSSPMPPLAHPHFRPRGFMIWSTGGLWEMESPLLETMGTELLAPCPSTESADCKVSGTLASIWRPCLALAGAHSQQSSRQESPLNPSPHQHTHRHTGRSQSLALPNLSALPHLHVTAAQAKTISAGPWDPDELCDCIATHRLIW